MVDLSQEQLKELSQDQALLAQRITELFIIQIRLKTVKGNSLTKFKKRRLMEALLLIQLMLRDPTVALSLKIKAI